jgi:hypothetical protein
MNVTMGYRLPAEDASGCGESYDHDIREQDCLDAPEGPWVCRRPECGAEIYPEQDWEE